MQKQILEFDFNDCITEQPIKITEDLLVIYPVDAGGALLDYSGFAHEYIESANLIVDTMYRAYSRQSKNIFYDKFAIPVLNLYVNAVEFALKMLINSLIKHKGKKCCQLIDEPPDKYEDGLMNHELIRLTDICKKMIPKKGGLHIFPEFHEFTAFIASLEKYGVNSMSTRYQIDRKGNPYELHKLRQSWLNPMKFKKNITFICNTIIDYAFGDHFILCSKQEFTKERLEELLLAKKVMQQTKSFFDNNMLIPKKESDLVDMNLDKALEESDREEKEFLRVSNALNNSPYAAALNSRNSLNII